MSFLGQDYKSKNVINIDETWLGMSDFRRRHWKPIRGNFSVRAK
jgi:hypothetical protein